MNREEAIIRCVESYTHASLCQKEICVHPHCKNMKKVVAHTYRCKAAGRSYRCPVCRQMIALCHYHAQRCSAVKCNVPMCGQLRKKIAENQRKEEEELEKIGGLQRFEKNIKDFKCLTDE